MLASFFLYLVGLPFQSCLPAYQASHPKVATPAAHAMTAVLIGPGGAPLEQPPRDLKCVPTAWALVAQWRICFSMDSLLSNWNPRYLLTSPTGRASGPWRPGR